MSKQNKFILWCVMVGVTSFWMWAGVQAWLRGSLFQTNPDVLGILTILLIVLFGILAMGLVLFQNRLLSIYLGLIAGVTFLILFGISNLNLVGVFIMIMLFYHAQDIVYGEIKERVKMNSRILLRKGLMNFVVGFFVLISFAAYQSPAIESFKNITELPSATNIFIKEVTEQTLKSQLSQIEPVQREIVLNQITQEIIHEANTFLTPYFEYVPPALAFGLFLVLWGVSWIFTWLSVFFGMLIFLILKKTNFFKIDEYDTKAERITI